MPLPRLARRAPALCRALALCGASAFLCSLTVLCPLTAAWAGSGGLPAKAGQPLWEAPAATGYSATLEQCVSSATAAQRSVTFAGHMVAVEGTQRMAMRIDLQERDPAQPIFHAVVAPGLDIWRGSDPGVKIYRYVKQITNLSAPAVYRAVVHFRWLGEKGRVLKHAMLRTAQCEQRVLS